MEQITIQVKDKQKARVLRDFLQTLDFVESITSEKETAAVKNQPVKSTDFFNLAGLWAGRDISLESIRKQAWPSH